MTYDVISYILIGGLFVSLMAPLIGLLVRSAKEQKHLDEVKDAKKRKTPLTEQDVYSLID